MSGLSTWAWDYDGWIVLAGILCAISASLPGNFLLLRRMSLLGDAISHAILPGLAVAFFISESRSSVPMFAAKPDGNSNADSVDSNSAIASSRRT